MLHANITWDDCEAAEAISLRGGPASSSATRLIDETLHAVVLPAGVGKGRPSGEAKARRALGALLSDLFDLQATSGRKGPRCGSHGMSPAHFPSKELGFGRDLFVPLVGALEAAGLLDIARGLPRWHTFSSLEGGEDAISTKGRVTRFRMTPALLQRAADLGVGIDAWQEHWGLAAAQRVRVSSRVPRLVLKGRKVRQAGRKLPAPELPIDPADPTAVQRLAEVEALNAYLGAQAIGGVAFPGLRRVFNDGDQPGFLWRWGGRYTSLPGGGRYEGMSRDDRLSRITINGQAVGEADMAAAHLTLFYALHGETMDGASDPYALPGLPRSVVKSFVTQALGSSRLTFRQWSSDAKERYEATGALRTLRDDYPLRVVREAVLARHPVLAGLEHSGISTLDLQFHEAEVLRLAMEALRDRWNKAVLPIHDGLIVPRDALGLAGDALRYGFASHLESELGKPCLTVPGISLIDVD